MDQKTPRIVTDTEMLERLRKHAGTHIRLRDTPEFWIGLWCGCGVCLLPGAALFIWIIAQ